jgi:hypothetical protein
MKTEGEIIELATATCTCSADEDVCVCGAHGPGLSPNAQRARKRKIAVEMAENPVGIAAQRRVRIKAGQSSVDLPTPEQVYRLRSQSRQGARASGGSSLTEFRAAMMARAGAVGDPKWKMVFQTDVSVLDIGFAVLLVESLLDRSKRGSTRSGSRPVRNFGLSLQTASRRPTCDTLPRSI